MTTAAQPANDTVAQVAQAAHPITEQVGQILQSMREAAPHVTEALVRLTFAQGIEMLIVSAIAFIGFVFFVSAFNVMAGKGLEFDRYGDPTSSSGFRIAKCIGCGFGALVSTIIFFTNIGNGIIYTIAPEGQTIINIISALHGAAAQ